MTPDDVLLLCTMFGMWVGISRFCFTVFACPENLKPKNNKDKKTKVYYDYYGNYVSICHAIISMILSSYVVCTEKMTFGEENTFAVKIAVYNSFAYFIYDTIISEYQRYNAPAMTLHHIGTVSAGLCVFYTNRSGYEFAFIIILAELSNPFNLYREILKHWKQESSPAYFKSSILFAALFIVSRFIIFPYFLRLFYTSATLLFMKFLMAFVWFISWHWLFVIFNFAVKELKVFVERGDENKKKNNIMAKPYATLVKLRKNKVFLASFYFGAFWLSFGTLYMSHPRV